MHVSRARSRVTAWLTDTCTITGPASIDYDEEAGHDVDDAGQAVYTGDCRITPASAVDYVNAGEAPIPLRLYNLFLPWDTVGIEVDQLVTITASTDLYLVERIFRVVDVEGMTDGVYRRLLCQDTLDVAQPEAS